MTGFDFVMASVCFVMLLLSVFGLYVYFNMQHMKKGKYDGE